MPYQVQLASGKAGEMGNEITKLGHEGISTEWLDNGLASWYSNKIAAAKKRNMDGAKTSHLSDFGITIWYDIFAAEWP